jgi:hypothetical protein
MIEFEWCDDVSRQSVVDLWLTPQLMSLPSASVTCRHIDPIRSGLKLAVIAGSKCAVAAA